jgi:mycothiol system anti-sigma-R factor
MTNNETESIKNISCDEAIQRIFSFIDNALENAPRAELEHHLETCRHCFDRVEFEKLLKSRLQKLKTETKSETLRKKIEEFVDQF